MLQLERLLRRGGFECFNLARSDYEWITFVRIRSCFPASRDRDLIRQLITQIRQVHLHELAYQSIGRTHHVTHWENYRTSRYYDCVQRSYGCSR